MHLEVGDRIPFNLGLGSVQELTAEVSTYEKPINEAGKPNKKNPGNHEH